MSRLQPRSFTKIAFDERRFEVSWIPPVNANQVTSYTIFWCRTENNRDRPYQCAGYLDWMEVSNETRFQKINMTTDHVYQFAVAANTENYSSGMQWATCTILHNKGTTKVAHKIFKTEN